MKNKYLALLYSTLAVIIPVILIFEILMYTGFSPLLTNSISFDAKIKYAQKEKIKQVDLMAIGSSMTLNNLSSQVIKDSIKTSYFNFSAWGLQIGDIRQMVIKYLPKYKPKFILISSSLRDFTVDNSVAVADYLNTPDFFKDYLEEYFYIENYNSISNIKQRKTEYHQAQFLTNDYRSLNFDKSGGILLNIPLNQISADRWNQLNIFPTKYTNKQYMELAALSSMLKNEGVLLIFIQPPIRNAYLNNPKSKQIVEGHYSRCRKIITSYGGAYLNFTDPKKFSEDKLFVDQFHLSAAGATLFTKEVAHTLKTIINLQ